MFKIKKLLCILLLIPYLLMTNNVYADELTPPEQPVISDNTSVEDANRIIEEYNTEAEQYNEYVDEYNAQVDNDYAEAVEDYNSKVDEVTEHNQVEDEKVAEVEAYNAEEDEKVTKSQEELEIIEQKVENNLPGTEVVNYTTDADNLPTDWSDVTPVEDLRTIEVEKSDDQSGETARIINLHLYLDSEYVPNELFIGGSNLTNDQFLLSQELKDALIFAEWEVAEFDLNDTVTTMSEATVYQDERIRHDGKNYKVQNYDSRFIRNVEDYTQGAWMASGTIASNANTLEYGWGYDFETGEGKGGDIYISQFTPEERIQYYLEDGELKEEAVEVRTIDGTEPKNILSIFSYIFQRFWEEPVEYEPDYHEYTPDYMEMPEEPTKGEYLNKVDLMDLRGSVPEEAPKKVIEPDPEPVIEEPVPTPFIDNTAKKEEVKPVDDVIIEIIDTDPPMTDDSTEVEEEKTWALFNLICSILTALSTLLTVIFFKRKVDENEEEIIKNSYITLLLSVILSVGSIWLFLITEDITLKMAIFDKYSPIMFILLLVGICGIFTRAKKKEKPEE